MLQMVLWQRRSIRGAKVPACGQAVGAREDSCNVVAEAGDKDTDTSDGIRPIMDQDPGCIILWST